MQFQLTVTGVEGKYTSTLRCGDTVVAEFESRDVKSATKQANAEALSFKAANVPARLESYAASFSV